MNEAPTFGSLFAGIGGLDLGLERAGWRCRWQVEIDPFSRRVLEQHWPDVPRWCDVRDFINDLGRLKPEFVGVDLVVGGFPCQPFSHAGARRGTADERWLWPEFARVVRELRPSYVLVENVPGLLAVTGGMGDVLGDLAASGYDAEWDCIPASAVGAPHRRDRVWIVAHANRDGESVFAFDAEAPWVPAVGAWDADRASENAHAARCGSRRAARESARWDAEPDVPRVDDGVPAGLDRRKALGNAVVPQVAEWIGRRLMAAHLAAAGRNDAALAPRSGAPR